MCSTKYFGYIIDFSKVIGTILSAIIVATNDGRALGGFGIADDFNVVFGLLDIEVSGDPVGFSFLTLKLGEVLVEDSRDGEV